ncbi:MAG TPA: serine/threonine-protein kinase [Mycobacteriales bacterium]|nr:serine/threonine-protein kinase [Mycobacteriales bacterium]
MDQPFTVPGYRLVSLLGFGGTGEVWRGVEDATGQPVALKRLWEPAGPELVRRLQRDAMLLEQAAGAHTIAAHDITLLPNNEVVLVLEYAAAGSLATLLSTRPQLRHPEVVTLLGPLARALAAAHSRGLRHGDVTPSNVVFTADGRPKLTDFGLAIATGERRADDPLYRDPALSAGEVPGPAADVFGLAAIGFAALTGVPPRPADATGGVPSVTELAPDVPPALASAVDAAMSPDPSMRPDAAAFAAAVFRSSGADPIRFADQRRTTTAAVPVAHRREPSRRAALTVVIFAAVGLSALTGAGWVKLGQRPAAAVQPPAITAPSPTPAVDYSATIAHLLALRDRAFATTKLSVLRQLYPSKSAGWDVDAAALRVLRSQHLRTRGFVEHIDSITVKAQSLASVDLLVTTAISAYSVVDQSGRVVVRRPARTQDFEVLLHNVAGKWVVQGIGPAAS